MRRTARIGGGLMIVAGTAALAWALTVWQWQDPFTALYTHWQQRGLAHALDRELARYRPPHPPGAGPAAARRLVAEEARRFRRTAEPGRAIGRISVARLGLNMVLVDGTDHASLEKGPGWDARSFLPGENRLVYVAGHRTTYLAPFSHIDLLRRGDAIRLELPYATFMYRVLTHRVVAANDLSVLRSPRHELLELQACHPRFFATHRYIVYARLATVRPRGGAPYAVGSRAAS